METATTTSGLFANTILPRGHIEALMWRNLRLGLCCMDPSSSSPSLYRVHANRRKKSLSFSLVALIISHHLYEDTDPHLTLMYAFEVSLSRIIYTPRTCLLPAVVILEAFLYLYQRVYVA